MSNGVSYRTVANEFMHDGKRYGFTLEQVLTNLEGGDRSERLIVAVSGIVRERYAAFRPRMSAYERCQAGQTWNWQTRRWDKPTPQGVS